MLDEPLFRQVNRRIHDLGRGVDGPTEYLCECEHVTCRASMIELALGSSQTSSRCRSVGSLRPATN